MNTTPLWVPLVVAAVGLVTTLVGIAVTQFMANRRERADWARELAREQERWLREDKAITFEHRRKAYVDFYVSLRRTMLRVYDHGAGISDEGDGSAKLPLGWHTDPWEKLQQLQVYGSPGVASLATRAYANAYRWGSETWRGDADDRFFKNRDEADVAKNSLLEAIREELGVPGTPPTMPSDTNIVLSQITPSESD